MVRVAACVLVVALVACAAVGAARPGTLPRHVVPLHYSIELEPDLQALTLRGSAAIDVEVREPTSEITLNALDLDIARALLEGEAGQGARVAYDRRAQRATLAFPRELARGTHRLRIDYTGRINAFGRGLFYVDYPAGDTRKRMLATQLESAEARRVFPSWDQPAFKATFDVSVVVPDGLLAVSNMPVASELVRGASRRIAFERTPKMSTYLFVLAVGDLERITREHAGVTLGVVATAGKAHRGAYALDSAARLLDFYNAYFGVRYPLPKLDLIALPGGLNGAMENWGGITFSEPLVLFDPGVSAPGARRSIFGVLAHEMAHLWFGDLVTMAWWDDLWLNEGFASWMEAKATEALHPGWEPWLHRSGAKQSAMRDDARRTSHAVRQPVANESEAMAAFDRITYSKGQAFLRMLERHVGEETFRAGIRRYVTAHAYANATTQDLWRALETASGEPIGRIADPYTSQPGVPLVVSDVSCVDGRQQLLLRQERFSVRDPQAAPLRWPVPIVYGRVGDAGDVRSIVLEGEASIEAGACGEAIKLNLADVGYYRVLYGDAQWRSLERAVPRMGAHDRVNLLNDAWALAEAGRAPPERFLAFVAGLREEPSRAVWEQVMRVLDQIDGLQQGRLGRDAFRRVARTLLRPAYDRLGWTPRRGESQDDALLRSELLRRLGDLDDPDVAAEGLRRFAALEKDPAAVPAALRAAVMNVAGRACDARTCEQLLRLARNAPSVEERRRYYFALARSTDRDTARRTLELTLTDELPTNIAGPLIVTVASAGEHGELAWRFAQEHLARLQARQGPAFAANALPTLATYLPESARALERLSALEAVRATPLGRIQAARAAETIAVAEELRLRLLPAIDAWVAAHASARASVENARREAAPAVRGAAPSYTKIGIEIRRNTVPVADLHF